MLNVIWVAMLAAAVVCGALTGKLDAVAKASTDSAAAAVELAIGLVGVMAFWLGLMRVLQNGGLLLAVARLLRPVMCRLFPDVPADHPAMGMMILNMTANMLGLGNAATPFGLKAMMELDRLNVHKGTTTNAMTLFLAINTSNIALLPTGMVALRASLGSQAPGSIIATTLIATTCSTLVAIVAAKALSRLPSFGMVAGASGVATEGTAETAASSIDTNEAEKIVNQAPPVASRAQRVWGWSLVAAVAGAFLWALVARATDSTGGGALSAVRALVTEWPLVVLIVGFVLYGVVKGVSCYDAVVEGGKEGFQVALRIIPYLVAILVAVGMLRASGAIDAMVVALEPVTSLVGMPAEALPMALLRPLSGSGAYGVAAEIMRTQGPDSLVGNIVSTIQGSTETTFYVLALYYGVVQIRNTRHTVPACLLADAAGVLASVWACRLLLT